MVLVLPHGPYCLCKPPLRHCPAGTGLGVIDTAAHTLTPLSTPYTLFGRVNMVEGPDGRLSMLTTAASSTKASAVVLFQVIRGCQAHGCMGGHTCPAHCHAY
jgi:hypothetical protein